MCPYGLHSHVVMDDIYNYKPNHGCSHIMLVKYLFLFVQLHGGKTHHDEGMFCLLREWRVSELLKKTNGLKREKLEGADSLSLDRIRVNGW